MSVAGMNVDSGQKTWLTPPEIIRSLGEFDLDPCVPDSMPWQTAKRMVTKAEDGLTVDWNGKRVWLNPPYGRESYPFLRKMAEQSGGGVAFLFGRTDTGAWQDLVFPNAHSVLFMRGRTKFHREDGSQAGSANAPSCLVAYSAADTEAIRRSGIGGTLMVKASAIWAEPAEARRLS